MRMMRCGILLWLDQGLEIQLVRYETSNAKQSFNQQTGHLDINENLATFKHLGYLRIRNNSWVDSYIRYC